MSVGRRAKFSDETILEAALGVLVEGGVGAATVTGVADRLGAPSGSIYHRFASRDLLMARLWVRTVLRFQRGFVDALDTGDTERAAREAMLHTVRWSREHPADALVLLGYRREDLVARWPEELGQQLVNLNQPVRDALAGFVRVRYTASTPELVARVRFALVDIPYAAVRMHLTRGSVPAAADEELVLVAGAAILAHLDDQGTS